MIKDLVFKSSEVEKHRDFWIKIAKENAWFKGNLFIQCYIDGVTGKINDSIYRPVECTEDIFTNKSGTKRISVRIDENN